MEDAWDDTASTYDGGMEVDIMESLGIWGANVTSHAMHWDGYATGHPAAGSGKINYSASSDGFHVFGLYWGAGKLAFYVDGVKTHEWVNARVATVPAYLLLSLQLGGWDGNTPGAQVNNQVMEVDWVRVWSGDQFIPSTVTVDNTDSASVSAAGSWTAAAGVPGYLGSNYQHDENTGKGSKSFHFLPQLTGEGDYLVYARWTSGTNRASNVPIDILDSQETTWPVMVNQRTAGGIWNLIGGYALSVANAEVALFNQGTDGYVIADSMKFVPAAGDASAVMVDNSDTAATLSTGTWTASSSTPGYIGSNYLHDGNTGKGTKTFSYKPVIPAVGDYLVYARWTSDSNRANNVPVDIVRSDGVVETVTMNQTKNGGKWVLLGGWSLSPSNAEVKIRTDGTSGYVVADSVRVLPSQEAVPSTITVDNADAGGVTITGAWTSAAGIGGFYGANYIHDDNTGKGSKSVRFTPNLPLAGSYEVFARWTSGTNRASNVPMDIVWSGGTESVQVDQKSNGGAWISLGTYSFNAGSSGNVLISTTGTNGYVIADAVRFVRQP